VKMKKDHTDWNLDLLCDFLRQDLHFSIHEFPLQLILLIQALFRWDYRVGINYRNQWSSVMSIPYKTMSALAMLSLCKIRITLVGWVLVE
jgi:hypothetical protein